MDKVYFAFVGLFWFKEPIRPDRLAGKEKEAVYMRIFYRVRNCIMAAHEVGWKKAIAEQFFFDVLFENYEEGFAKGVEHRDVVESFLRRTNA